MATADEYARWIIANQDRRGTPEFETVAKAYQQARGAVAPKDYRAMQTFDKVDPTEGMGQLDRFNAGLGKAMVDIGSGAAQLVGMGPTSEETRNRKELDKPLMNTGAGMAGNVSGNIAMLAPLAVAPAAATVGGAGTLGAIAAGVQPTEGVKERLVNMLTGFGLGAGTQAAVGPGARKLGEWGAEREAAKAAERSQNSVRDATLKAGQEAGLGVPSSVINPSMKNSVMESVAGKAATGQAQSLNNQKVVDALMRQEAGLPANQALSETALKNARKAAAGPYRELTAISPQAKADMDALKAARLESKLQWQEHGRIGNVAAYKAATAADQQAAQLEQSLLTEAQNVGRADLLPALKEARQQIAKIHDIERSLNVGSGSVDSAVLGRMRDKGVPLTGGLKTVADFQQAFPAFMREGAKVPSPGVSKIAAALSGVGLGAGGFAAGGPAGAAAAAVPFVVPPAARSMVLKAGRTVSPDYALSASERIAAALADRSVRDKIGLAARSMALPMLPYAMEAQ